MTGNERRHLTRMERRADAAGTVYVVALIWMTAGAAFFAVSVIGWITVLGVRAW